MTRFVRVVSLVLLVLAPAHRTFAQTVSSTTGAINGTVTDSTQSVLPGVTVTLTGAS
jgi:hypothetical protein